MNRRNYLSFLTGTAVAIAGCTGGDSALLSGSTQSTDIWYQDLERGQSYELEVTLNEGRFAEGAVERQTDTGLETVVRVQIIDGDSDSKEFEAPHSMEYSIGLSTDGHSSFTLREI